MDLYPTLVDLAGFDQPAHLDGHSLVPQLKNPEIQTSPVITSYQFSWTKQPVTGHAVRSLQHRYIYYPEINFEELYDHDADPAEWNNIAYKEKSKPIIEEHRNHLLKLLPDLKWQNSLPEGYTIDKDGNVHKTDYLPAI
jgi:arylsulfatase A-like enzyme